MEELLYHLWLTLLLGANNIQTDYLLSEFDSAADVYEASARSLREVEGITHQTVETIINGRDLTHAKDVLVQCRKLGIKIIPSYSDSFPERLQNIYCPPHILYVKGDIGAVDEELCIGMVGTRNCSTAGMSVTRKIGRDLASFGVTVVSGGAKGIDSYAIKGAQESMGRTLCVLGCGVDVVYPRENGKLFTDVSKNGAVISEYPPGTSPMKHHFPERNRIISGLCQGTIIVEAPKNSGALITAQCALEQGRDVFAVPGDVTNLQCEGSNDLIKSGAKAVTQAQDILSEYRYFIPVMYDRLKIRLNDERRESEEAAIQTIPDTSGARRVSAEEVKRHIEKKAAPKINTDVSSYDGLEGEILRLLLKEDLTADALGAKTGADASDINTALISLEMDGAVIKKLSKDYSII